MVKVGRLLLAVAALCVSFGVGGISYAQDFYKGKTIHFIVGYSAGGSFDLYTRVIARHIGKYIAGNPNTVVENMTGAGGIIAAKDRKSVV